MDGTHLNNKIGIVGGGITGLISAYFLSQAPSIARNIVRIVNNES